MSESSRIVNLLGHYRDRLRHKGDEDHDEELDYLVSILESPFMRDFLQGRMSHEDTAHFNEVTSEVISALEEQEEDRHLSPETQRKRLLRRRASLRALKLAVTPQSSPVITPRNSQGTLSHHISSSNDSPLLQSVMATLNSREATPLPDHSQFGNNSFTNSYTGKWDTPIATPTSDSIDSSSVDMGRKDSVTTTTTTSSSLTGSQITVIRGGDSDMPSSPPNLPSYNEALSTSRRARSYEKLPAGITTPPHLAPLVSPGSGGPRTAGSPTRNTPLGDGAEPEEMKLVVSLVKGDRGLGFSVSRHRTTHGKEGQLLVHDIQPGGVAERDGQLQKGDRIISINGQNVTNVSHSTAVSLLQQTQGNVDLVLARYSNRRESPQATPPPHPTVWNPISLRPFAHNPPSMQSASVRDGPSKVSPPRQTPPPNSLRRNSLQHQIAVVDVFNQEEGQFGFSIISKDGVTFVHLLSPGSQTEREGKLCPGDQILSINGESVVGVSHSSVLDRLQALGKSGHSIRLVLSRATNETPDDDSFSDIDSSSSDIEEIEVELVKAAGKGGLGISINALVNDESEEDKGIYIRSVNPHGPAGLSGLVRRKDRIMSVNGKSLKSISNMMAANELRNAGTNVKLVLGRKMRPGNKLSDVKESQRMSEDIATSTTDTANDDAAVTVTAEGKNRQMDKTGQIEASSEETIGAGSKGEEQYWTNIIGTDKEVITAHIDKVDDCKGLGFGMESIAVVDDTGQTQIGSVRHIIKYIRKGGPMDISSQLMVGDEILEVNGNTLVGVSHEKAIDSVREATNHVTIVVCRDKKTEEQDNLKETSSEPASDTPDVSLTIEVQQPTTSESEDDHCSSGTATTITSSSSPALQAIYQNFSRRFERQSWRERHNEETRRLKERFELRREHYNRFLQEQEDELLRVEKEAADRKLRQLEEEKQKQETEEKRSSSLQSGLHYSYYAPLGFQSLHEATMSSDDSPETNNRDSMASEESSTSALSPVPGSVWENEVSEIELVKEKDGLGFSILDFADASSPGDRVILVHSLVSEGTAERDGRLQKGDKLISVNGVSVVNHTLDFTVEQLKSVSLNGTVRLGVNHPLPVSPDFDSTSSSFSPDIHHLLNDTLNEEIDSDKEDGKLKTKTDKRSTLTPGSTLEKACADDELKDLCDSVIDPLEKESRQDSVRSATPDFAAKKGTPVLPHPFFSRTRSDEPANARRASNSQQGGVDNSHNLRLVESTSEETLVGSSSHQDLHLSSNQPSPKQQTSPLMRGKPQSTASQDSSKHTSTVTANRAGVFSPSRSQDSFLEGLSPDTSDTGDHSAEMEAEPRDIDIRKGTAHLGMSVMEDKGFIVVKKIDSGSVLAKDGRIRVGDRILAINGKSVEGLSLAKVKSMLKRASSAKSTKVKITYLPAPQGFTLTYSSTSSLTHADVLPAPQVSQYSSVTTASVQQQPALAQVPMTIHPMPAAPRLPLMTTPHGHTHHSMQQQQSYQWHQPPPLQYNPIPRPQPPPQIPQYMEHPTPIKPHPPPPPYDVYQTSHISSTSAAGIMRASTQQQQQQQQYHHQQQWNEYPATWRLSGGGPPPIPQYSEYSGQQQQPQQQQQYTRGNVIGANTAAAPTAGTKGRIEQQQQMRRVQQQAPPPPHYMTDGSVGGGGYPSSYGSHTYSPPQVSSAIDPAASNSGDGYDQMCLYKEQQQQQTDGGQWGEGYTTNEYRRTTAAGGYMERSPPHVMRLVEVIRNAAGSLGISLGTNEGGGVVINAISPACQSMTKGQLGPGDKILEVNGIDLRSASQSEAISIIMNSGNPVHILVQSYSATPTAVPPTSGKRRTHTSPLHSNDGSWAIDEEEDDELRQVYPSANGHLYQVTLNKGQGGLGLSICKISPSPHSGVSIMQIQPGSVADQIRKIKRGDELIQVNDHCIIGWSQKDVSDLLSQTSLHVRLVLIRPLPEPYSAAPTVMNRPSQSLEQQQLLQQQSTLKYPSVDMSGLALVKAVNLERDDEIGLGFTVSKADFNGETGVVISSIIPRGPADKEGQLKVGDYIISIDGHKVLGTKFEKATHLLQQARCNGSVSLIISTKGQLTTQLQDKIEKSPRKQRNMGEKRMRVRSEGVTLRNKVIKAQRSTRRRPVSVDCEVNYESKDIAKMSSNSREESGNYGNHTTSLTQAEMQQNVDFYTSSTTDQDVVVGKATDIEIFRGNQPLGVVISGGIDSYQDGIYIQKIHSKTPASLDGRLRVGDRIVKIGDVPLENATREQAKQILMEAPGLLQLTVYRSPSDRDTSSRSYSQEPEIETVELLKPENGGLGLMILEDETQGGVIVKEVLMNEVADISGRIHPGDKILAINGEDISNASQDFVSRLLQTCHGLVSLTVHHMGRDTLLRFQESNSSIASSTQDYDMSPVKRGPKYQASSPPMRMPRPPDPPPYSSDPPSVRSEHRESTPLRSTDASSYDDDELYSPHRHHPQQYRDVVGQSLPEARLTYGTANPLRVCPDHRANTHYVTLKRGITGLGFSIAGGKGSPNGDLPICIRSIGSDCLAAREGRIRKGDIILAVNGISFDNITHKAAVDTLTHFHGDITLKIQSKET